MHTLNNSTRDELLKAAKEFVLAAREIAGVRRISMIGSLLTDKRNPKDVDLLVRIADDTDLASLAARGRRLKGRAQSFNHGADVFLADETGRYLGRTCHWKDCRPGIRVSCVALHCGRRQYLHDDLQEVRLSASLVNQPPLDLWPAIVRRVPLPPDVENFVADLESSLT